MGTDCESVRVDYEFVGMDKKKMKVRFTKSELTDWKFVGMVY